MMVGEPALLTATMVAKGRRLFILDGETWVREQGRWREIDVVGPSPRSVHAMSYDPLRQQVVLYGGIGEAGRLGDLWEWDGARWLQIH